MTGTELLVRIARELPNRFCSVLISNSITRINTRISIEERTKGRKKEKEYPSMEETRRWCGVRVQGGGGGAEGGGPVTRPGRRSR
jgi:hypothetical protein